jgi:hypothetical protein
MAKAPQADTLSAIEAARLAKLESAIEAGVNAVQAVHEAGKALAEVRDRQLYRQSFTTFSDYVLQRWQLTDRRASQLIAFAGLRAALEETGTVVPETLTERAARPLTGLDPADAAEALAEAAGSADGITAGSIAKAAAKRKKKAGKAKVQKPVRFKVPGAIVIVQFNRKASGSAAEALEAALRQAGDDQAEAAA